MAKFKRPTYQAEIPIANNVLGSSRSLDVDHPDNKFIKWLRPIPEDKLKELIHEVFIRFDTSPDNYLKDDYMHLIYLLLAYGKRTGRNTEDIKELKKVIEQILSEGVEATDSLVSIRYEELVQLIENKELEPGTSYRITDYTFTTTQENTDSAHHDFDIIVVADSEDTLNENARACKKEGDEYYANNNLAAWELKYTVFNDTSKYTWADSENGKGVIYWLKDDFNNEAGYDFKSALYNSNYTFTNSLNCKIIFNQILPYNIIQSCSNIKIQGCYNTIKNCVELKLKRANYNNLDQLIRVCATDIDYVTNNNSIIDSEISNVFHTNLISDNEVRYKTITNIANTTVEFNQEYANDCELITQVNKIITYID